MYEGLWDLYCKRPQTEELNAKKLEQTGFVQKVKLCVPPADTADEEGNVSASAAKMPLKAVVRVRIPLKRPPPEQPEGLNEDDDGKTDEQKKEQQKEQQMWQSPPPSDRTYDEQDIEDKVLLINTIGESYKIWVMHQAAARWLRKDLVQQMKKNVKELETVDLAEMISVVEQHAVEVENNLLKVICQQDTPIFDFELN